MEHRCRRAFTLVELLVVVMIIALLVGILAPTVGRALEQTKRASCRNNLREIARGCKQYALETRLHRGPVTKQALPAIAVTASNWSDASAGQKACLWLLVNNKFNSRASFVCPSMVGYAPADENATAFTDYTCSYSYISMVGRTLSMAERNLYTDLVIIGDKNPHYNPGSSSPISGVSNTTNSLAHLARDGTGEGQNVATLAEQGKWLDRPMVVTGGVDSAGNATSNRTDYIYLSTGGGVAVSPQYAADVLLID